MDKEELEKLSKKLSVIHGKPIEIVNYKEGLYTVKSSNKLAFMNEMKKIVTPFKYTNEFGFVNGKNLVTIGDYNNTAYIIDIENLTDESHNRNTAFYSPRLISGSNVILTRNYSSKYILLRDDYIRLTNSEYMNVDSELTNGFIEARITRRKIYIDLNGLEYTEEQMIEKNKTHKEVVFTNKLKNNFEPVSSDLVSKIEKIDLDDIW